MINFRFIKGENLNILDYGCGTGVNTIKLIKMGHRLTAVDIRLEYGDEIMKMPEVKEITNFKFICLTGNNIYPEFKGKFEVIVCTETLEHVKQYDEILNLFKKNIANKGILIISVPTEFSEKFFSVLDRNWPDESQHVHIFNTNKLINQIKEKGFQLFRKENKGSEWFLYWLFLKIFRIRHVMGIPDGRNEFQQSLIKFANRLLKMYIILKPVNKLFDVLLPKSTVLYFKLEDYDS
jgi:2-polyprenyl-3-methyl-5-hydroxy-6-metoxy-1,4-benzoquinol methylase